MNKETETNDDYPGKEYQRLFNAIENINGVALQSEMDNIIGIVREDFPVSSTQEVSPEEIDEILRTYGVDIKFLKEQFQYDEVCNAIKAAAYANQPAQEVKTADWQEISEELWDKHAQMIGDDIDSLQYYASRNVILEHDFKSAIKEVITNKAQ